MARNIHHPHDKFMKSLMGDIEVAREYFEAFLPESIKKVVDLSKLEHSPHSFISEQLKETQADIVLKCPLIRKYKSQEVYLCFILEHRSTTYKYVSIQQGGYIFDAYRKQLKNKETPLIPVIPLLYYHGSKEWNPADMQELFELAPLSILDYIPAFKILFDNIQNYSDDQIRELGSSLFTSALITQKYADRPELLLERFKQIFSILGSWKGRNLFNTLIVYYIELVELEEEELNLMVDQIPTTMKTEFVSLADRLREKGMERGMERGMEKKNWTASENMLRKAYKVSEICDILDVTPEFVERVRKEMDDSCKN